MKNFLRLTAPGQSLDVMPALHALSVQSSLWEPMSEDADIVWLREPPPPGAVGSFDWSPKLARLPQVRPLVMNVGRVVEACELGCVSIERLLSGRRLQSDVPPPGWQRYHIVIQGLPGSLFGCGDETVQMLSGEAWWIDARQQRGAENNSAEDRIHIVMDVRLWP